jgi:hypothetical protein
MALSAVASMKALETAGQADDQQYRRHRPVPPADFTIQNHFHLLDCVG